jgi:ribosome-binding factor A
MANKSFSRSQRVAQQLQRALSELIRREVRDPRLGMVTLTEVRMASDLSYARVYYSVLGGDEAKAQSILDAAAELLRGPAGRALGLRHSPELRFVADELIQSGARLSALINKAVKEDAVRHVDSTGAANDADARESDADSRRAERASDSDS